MFSLAKCLDMLAKTGLSFSGLHKELPYRSRMHHTIPCPWEKKGIVMRKAMEFTENMDRILIDGITVNNSDSTIVIFPDKERPAFIVAVEASSDSDAMNIANQYKQLITSWAETQS